MRDILDKASRIKLVIFDVDGVLTTGALFIGDDGQEYKAFSSRDGLGMRMLQDSGVEIGIITGRTSSVVQHRMDSLGITHVFQGQKNKVPAFEELCQRTGVSPDEVAYVGDDIVDLPVLKRVGLSIAVADAEPLVVHHADWRTPRAGGLGAARDVCELIMQAQGTWAEQLKAYEI